MIRFKSIAEQRLDFAFEKVQEVVSLHTLIFKNGKNTLELVAAVPDKLKNDKKFQEKLLKNQFLIPNSRKKKIGGNKDYDEIQKNYHQYVKSFAMLVLNSGLVAALLFAHGKSKKKEGKAYEFIINHLTAWLKERSLIATEGTQAIKSLYGKSSPEIRSATLEAIRFLEDLKRVADARLYKPDEKTDKNG